MEKKKSLKAITSILTKVAGLVFFAFLAISLGVIFGTLFKDWVSEDPLSPVQGLTETYPYHEPLTVQVPKQEEPKQEETSSIYSDYYYPSDTSIKFKVQVGPYHVREEALQVAQSLQNDGYPVFVSRGTPCYVQVGAFSNPNNAGNLESELLSKGFPAYIVQD